MVVIETDLANGDDFGVGGKFFDLGEPVFRRDLGDGSGVHAYGSVNLGKLIGKSKLTKLPPIVVLRLGVQ